MKATRGVGNLEIAKIFRKVAAAYTILGENRFKVIAYDNAATAVEHATSELRDLWEEGKLDSVPGLGSSIQSHLDELFKTGHSKHLDQVLTKVNPAIFPLLDVPGLGPKKAEKLVSALGIKSERDVFGKIRQAAKSHKIAAIEGFGEQSEADVVNGIERFEKGAIKEKRMVLPVADAIAEELIEYLKRELGLKIKRIDKLGSLRRQVATIGDIDLATATESPKEVVEVFVKYPRKVEVIEKGPTGASLLLASGRQADLRVSDPDEYGAMLQYFTGSKYHNIRLRDYALKKGLSLSEYGIKTVKTDKICKFPSEEEFYAGLGLAYIPPEIREDSGEIEAALRSARGKPDGLPELVELRDIKGDLQAHSDFDQETSHDSGVSSMGELQAEAEKLGYEYLAITDHNPSVSRHTQSQIIAKLTAQTRMIEQLNRSTKSTRVLNMLEVDIDTDGNLTVPQEGLNSLDGCLVSIHSNLGMGKGQMTERVLKALSNPVARILAHPTGRLLGDREGYELDFERVFKFCLEHDKAIEVNCYPNRLDLPDVLVREAVKRGVKLSLGTDSHDLGGMTNMRFGVAVARRGWAEKKDIINSWSYAKLLDWLHKRS